MHRKNHSQIDPETFRGILKTVIHTLKLPNCKFSIFDSEGEIFLEKNFSHFQIIRTPIYDKENNPTDNFKFYYINMAEEPLGVGNFGAVHKCYPVDEKGNFFLDKNGQPKHAVVKILHNPKSFDKKEHRVFSTQYRSAPPLISKTNLPNNSEKVYVLMEALPGQQVDLAMSRRHPVNNPQSRALRESIDKLTFSERINLIMEIAINLNNLHHDTPWHEVLVHRDIKGQNMLLHIEDKTTKKGKSQKHFDVSIVDFGLTIEQEEKGFPIRMGYLVDSEAGHGSALHMAPETVQHFYGVKSDIYAVAPVIAMILGASNPFLEKEDAFYQNYPDRFDKLWTVASKSYNFEDMLPDNANVPPEISWVKNLIELFLNRMQNQEYQQRPDSDEILWFFVTLSQVCQKAAELEKMPHLDSPAFQGIQDSLNYEDKTKLLLLANGLWNIPIGEKPIEKWDEASKKSIVQEIVTKTCEDFDFAGNQEICRAIQILNEEGLLNVQRLKNLTDNPLQAQAIVTAYFEGTPGKQGLIQIMESNNKIKPEFDLRGMIKDFQSYRSGMFDSKHDKEQRNKWEKAIVGVVDKIVAQDKESLSFVALQEIYLCLKQIHQELDLKHHANKTKPGQFTKIVDKWLNLLANEVINKCSISSKQLQNDNVNSIQRQRSQSNENQDKSDNIRKFSSK